MNYTYSFLSPIGMLTAASDGTSLTGLWIEGQKYFKGMLKGDFKERRLLIFDDVKKWIESYFLGENPHVNFLINPVGSQFRQSVWKILCEIPYGKVITYGDISKRLIADTQIMNMSAQAVGGAVAHNPISIIVPCHRVVGANGSLTGYAGGINKKIMLLELEGVEMEKYYIPRRGTAL